MCQDHAGNGLSRRQFIRGSAGAFAGAALLGRAPAVSASVRPRPRPYSRPVADDGTSGYSMAMHIHSSFSEYIASMDAQLYQATLNNVDVLWWTDHDWRMDGLDYRQVVHFTSLDGEKPPEGQGTKPWIWAPKSIGPNGPGSAGGVVTAPCSPNDPVQGGALQLSAQSTSTGLAEYGYYCDSGPDEWNYKGNLNGQSLSIDVMLEPGWTQGFLELRISSSYHEASGGQSSGTYTLSYRVMPSGTQHYVTQGLTGIAVIPVVADGQTWTTVTVTPSDDIATLWPSLDPRDFSLYGLNLYAASSSNKTVTGYFDYLRFDRTLDGGELFAQQADMMTDLAEAYPAVSQQQGLEISWDRPHVNWFGGDVVIPQYGTPTTAEWTPYLENVLIPQIQEAGGLVSYNHPFGTSWTEVLLPVAHQDTLLQQAAAQLLPNAIYGVDILEVGYPERAGVDLAHHVALWDIFSRNAVFVTGSGVSDDHWGTDWVGLTWNWATSAWAASTAQSDLLAAISAGQAWCGSLSEFGPSAGACLNLTVDGECPMGSVSLSSLTSRQLMVTGIGIPSGGSLQVLQGDVDYAGADTGGLESNAVVVASYSDVDMAAGGGQATMPVDTSAESFVRTQVLDAGGTVVALSNPAWLLQNMPPNGIPDPRAN
jgi:hypothetical protein